MVLLLLRSHELVGPRQVNTHKGQIRVRGRICHVHQMLLCRDSSTMIMLLLIGISDIFVRAVLKYRPGK